MGLLCCLVLALAVLCCGVAGKAKSNTTSVHVAMLMGLGGETTSKGVVDMCKHVGGRSGFDCKVYHWNEWSTAGDWLKQANSKRVILGYSNGGSTLTNLAAMGFSLDLALALDPTIWLPMKPLEGNVKRAICFHDTNPLNPVGHAKLTKGTHFNGTLVTVDTSDLHLNVDTDPKIQKRCYDEIFAL